MYMYMLYFIVSLVIECMYITCRHIYRQTEKHFFNNAGKECSLHHLYELEDFA